MMWRLSTSFLAMLPLVAVGLVGCDDSGRADSDSSVDTGIDVPDPVDPPEQDPGEYLQGIEAQFEAAAAEFEVPIDVLKAVGYVESQWQMVEGEVEFEGLEPAFGTMALRGASLSRGAELLGVKESELKKDRLLNIRAAAAVLRDRAGEIDRGDLGAWAPAIAQFSGILEPDSPAAMSYIHQNVYALISNGLVVTDLDGNVISEIKPKAGVVPNYKDPNGGPVLAANPDYVGAVFRPSPNIGARPATEKGKVQAVIIHTCEGAYAGCWGWLVQKKAKVSAHYVVKEDGSEITQLVKEADRAFHIGATYDSKLNGGKLANLQGTGGNNFTVGIEHAGFGKQASWNTNLIDQSARLVCDITKRHGIPRDKFHIVGHGQLQPYNRTDPGPNWPWATYFDKINAACNGAPQEEDVPPVPPPQQPPPEPEPEPEPDPMDPNPEPEPEPEPDPDPNPKADPAEILVDSANSNNAAIADFYAPATWTATASTPGFYGSNYLYASTTGMDDGAEFWFYLNNPGSYAVDVWYTPGANRSTEAPIVAFDAESVELGYTNINMQSGGKNWAPAGTYNFTAGWNMVMISRYTTAGSVVIADAVRLRAD